jgi:hypothetical protein
MTALGSSSNTSPGISLAVILGGVLGVFALTALTAIAMIAALTFLSGVVVALVMQEYVPGQVKTA